MRQFVFQYQNTLGADFSADSNGCMVRKGTVRVCVATRADADIALIDTSAYTPAGERRAIARWMKNHGYPEAAIDLFNMVGCYIEIPVSVELDYFLSGVSCHYLTNNGANCNEETYCAIADACNDWEIEVNQPADNRQLYHDFKTCYECNSTSRVYKCPNNRFNVQLGNCNAFTTWRYVDMFDSTDGTSYCVPLHILVSYETPVCAIVYKPVRDMVNVNCNEFGADDVWGVVEGRYMHTSTTTMQQCRKFLRKYAHGLKWCEQATGYSEMTVDTVRLCTGKMECVVPGWLELWWCFECAPVKSHVNGFGWVESRGDFWRWC